MSSLGTLPFFDAGLHESSLFANFRNYNESLSWLNRRGRLASPPYPYSYRRVTEEVRQNLYVLPSEPSQLGDFWKVMPLPDLFPWTQISLYQPGVNITGADDLYSFLEADVVFAAEAGSGEQEPESKGAELVPDLGLYYQRDRGVVSYAAADEVF